jgi:ELWxxDGT repeat protein
MKKIFFLLSFLYMHFAFGQSLLKTFETSNKSSFPRYGVDVNGTLFFTAGQPLTGEVRVWKTDGTAAGTNKITSATGAPVTGPFPHFAATNAVRAFGNKALIIAAPANQNNDHELWVSDGTEAGTLRLADINPGNGDPYIQYLAVVNVGATTLAFFSADNGTNGQELYMTDGTQAGTILLKDINPGSASSEPFGFTVFNNSVYFFANNGTNGHELWITDGTSAGTNMLKDIVTGIGSSASPYGTNQIITNDYGMYLVLYDTSFPTNATKLYYSDGTSANTFSLGGYQYPRNFKKINNRIYFTMNDTYTNLMYIENNGAYVYPFFANLDTGGSVLNAEDLTVSEDTLYLTADYALNERRLYLVNNFIPSIAYTVADIVPSANSKPLSRFGQRPKVHTSWKRKNVLFSQ